MGITAPLTRNFRHVCSKFDIPIPQEAIDGGIFIDGVKVEDESLLPPGAGRWLPSNNSGKLTSQEQEALEEAVEEELEE